MSYLRLRQICLVAWNLQPVVDDLCHVFGLQVCYRDPGVAKYGLENALMRVGNQFIEVVAPLPGSMEGTAATRHLQRRGGDCGYMVILDCDNIAPWRAHMQAVGVREASYHEAPGYQGLQLHPADTGGALLEINHSPGGENLQGAYWPAGPNWQASPDSFLVTGFAAVGLASLEPEKLAHKWEQILQRAAASQAENFGIRVDPVCRLQFTLAAAGMQQGLVRVDLTVKSASQVIARAHQRTLAVDSTGKVVRMGGVDWCLPGQ